MAGPTPPDNRARAAQKYIVTVIFDLSKDEVLNAVVNIQKNVKDGVTLILVTDLQDISIFQLDNCITEYLPSDARLLRCAPEKNHLAYLRQRFDILKLKWRPIQIIPIGERASVLMAENS